MCLGPPRTVDRHRRDSRWTAWMRFSAPTGTWTRSRECIHARCPLLCPAAGNQNSGAAFQSLKPWDHGRPPVVPDSPGLHGKAAQPVHEPVKPALPGRGRPHDQCREREMVSGGRSRLLVGVPEQGHDSVDVVGEPACALDAEIEREGAAQSRIATPSLGPPSKGVPPEDQSCSKRGIRGAPHRKH